MDFPKVVVIGFTCYYVRRMRLHASFLFADWSGSLANIKLQELAKKYRYLPLHLYIGKLICVCNKCRKHTVRQCICKPYFSLRSESMCELMTRSCSSRLSASSETLGWAGTPDRLRSACKTRHSGEEAFKTCSMNSIYNGILIQVSLVFKIVVSHETLLKILDTYRTT